MLSKDQIDFLEKKIKRKLDILKEDINYLKESTKPISPENAIGRVSRMDAINNKSVAEESLRKALDKEGKLKEALDNIKNDDYNICQKCKKDIEFKRLTFMPECRRCSKCAR